MVAEEDPLVTLESDKATMDVPATAAGKVQDVRVKVGDTVSEGSSTVPHPSDWAASTNNGTPAARQASATADTGCSVPTSWLAD